MPSSPHRIRRLRWVLSARSRPDAFALRGRLRGDLDGRLLPMLAEVFDEAAPGDEVVHLRKLELRVVVGSFDELEGRLPELFRQRLQEEIQAQPRPQARELSRAEAVPRDEGASAAREGGALDAERKRDLHAARAPAPMPAEELFQYLTSGVLPWTLAGLDPAAIRAWTGELTLEALAAAAAAVERRPGSWGERCAGFFRLFQLVPEERHGPLARAIEAASPGAEGAAFVDAVSSIAADRATWTRYDRLRLAALTMALRGERLGEAPPPSQRLVASDASPPPATGAGRAGTLSHETPPRDVAGIRSVADLDRLWAPPPSHAAPTPATIPRGGGDAEAQAFGLTVECAGLALLQPYLARFFEGVGVVGADRKELPEAALPRAAALLHLLATGEEDAPGFELGFVKVLLGLRPDSPLVVAEGLVTAGDREEIDALLQAVLAHWSALKGTSPRGLRSAFLRRRGLLREDERGWRLQLEPAPFDVLLGQLPWSVSVVKLPWMRRAVFTEWAPR